MENVKLERCPFCGGEATLKTGEHHSYGDPVQFVAFVECVSCRASSGRVVIDMGEDGWAVKAREAARTLWNLRPKRPSGAWSWISDTSPMCSACGHVFDSNDNADAGTSQWRFCPACGVRMDRKG